MYIEKYCFLSDDTFINELFKYIRSIKHRKFGMFSNEYAIEIRNILDNMFVIERDEKLKEIIEILNYE